ncbi:DUF6126 family protein [Streptomyces tanashiensis]
MTSEHRTSERTAERWKAKGVAWRVFFYVVGTYVFLHGVGLLGAHAQQE